MLPPNRQLKKLGEITKLQNGYAFKSGDYINFSDTLNFRMSNIRPGGGLDLDHNKRYLPDNYIEQYSNFLLNDGDIVIAMTDMATDPKILAIPTTVRTDGRKLLLNQRVGRFYIQEDKLFPDYLKYLLLNPTIRNELVKKGGGGVQINLSSKDILDTEIPLPPLPTQHKIVALLDEASSQITASKSATQSQLNALDQLWQSSLSEVFEGKYTMKFVDELCTKVTDGTHATPKYIDKGVPFLSVKNVTGGTIDFSDTRFISQEEHEQLTKRCKPELNDLLYTKVGTTGIAKVIDIDREFSIFVSLALLKPKHDIIDVKFFEYMLNSPKAYEQAQARTRGVANRNLVINDIKQIQIPLPDLATQTRIVSQLDDLSQNISSLKSQYTAQLQNFDDLRASILDQAFKGELVEE